MPHRSPLHQQAADLFQAGQPSEAAMIYRRILASTPGDAEANHRLGVLALMAGHAEPGRKLIAAALESDPADAETWLHHGVALQTLGQDAAASYGRALALKPDYAEAVFGLANVRENQGRLDEAASFYARAAALKPDLAEAHNNLGGVLARQGKLDAAVAAYAQALAIRPAYAEAHNNLGNVLKEQGKLDAAVASFRQALAQRPDLAEVHNNLGNSLADLGKLAEAALCYARALEVRPDFALAASNLALLFNEQGNSAKALAAVQRALSIQPTPEAKNIFVACAKQMHWNESDDQLRDTLIRALTEPWGRPGNLARSAASLALCDPDLAASVARADAAWSKRLEAAELFAANGFDRSEPLLLALLVSAPLCDIALERFLTLARQVLLEIARSAPENPETLEFFCALARQCFINEYIYDATPDERQHAEALRDGLAAALADGSPVPALWLAATGAYFTLASVAGAERLLDMRWPESVAALLQQQVREPAEEKREEIIAITPIDDAVSLAVRQQYEENPFPRWVKSAPAGAPKNLVKYLAEKFPLMAFARPAAGAPQVLVAGCGTGQQAVETAWELQDAQILAVDLSHASLAYARRKSRELGLSRITYAQADLLRLDGVGPFDVIAAVGVLHHLGDPLQGWRKLLSLLRPGGFMKLGFYSETARQHVVRIRNWIAQEGYGASEDDIRRFRQAVMDRRGEADFQEAVKAYDFYSLSMCRDLFFHVQEHRFTLAQIADFLEQNKLTLLGFDLEPAVRLAYRQRFPNDPGATNLAQWQEFERENPITFTEMYQFWIQKPA